MRNTCSNCHCGTSGVSDLCPRCSKLAKFSGLHCICKAPIGKNNKSGLCKECRVKRNRGAGMKTDYENVSSLMRRKKTGEWTTCHMPGCDEYFELSEGQHPKMAWCSKCKQTPNYKNYDIYKNMTREVKI